MTSAPLYERVVEASLRSEDEASGVFGARQDAGDPPALGWAWARAWASVQSEFLGDPSDAVRGSHHVVCERFPSADCAWIDGDTAIPSELGCALVQLALKFLEETLEGHATSDTQGSAGYLRRCHQRHKFFSCSRIAPPNMASAETASAVPQVRSCPGFARSRSPSKTRPAPRNRNSGRFSNLRGLIIVFVPLLASTPPRMVKLPTTTAKVSPTTLAISVTDISSSLGEYSGAVTCDASVYRAASDARYRLLRSTSFDDTRSRNIRSRQTRKPEGKPPCYGPASQSRRSRRR